MPMNFSSIVSKKMEEIKRPPIPPVGTYRASVKAIPDITHSNDGTWEWLDFQFQLVEAQSDVDADMLREYGGLGPASRVRRRFMFNTTDDAAFKRTEFDLRRFLEEHLRCGTKDMALKEAIDAAVGSQCLVFIRHNEDKNDPEVKHAEVGRTAPLE